MRSLGGKAEGWGLRSALGIFVAAAAFWLLIVCAGVFFEGEREDREGEV